MAQLLVSAAGAAIGFAIGGPTGAQIGWAAGSMLGASLGPGVQGPRLSDTNVQISSYGAAIGIVWGGVRKAGNVFWSTPLEEHEEEEGGKGGPTVTTYSYSVSCAVGICEGVQGSVRRIWADAKLVFDASDTASEETKISSASFRDYFEFYPGDETQMPDPTIESKEGAGNVPAYRGTCYVVFTDLPLGDFGNRIPVFSFELSNASEQPSALEYVAGPRLGQWSDAGNGPYHSAGLTEYTVLGTDGVPTLTTTDFGAALAELASRAPLHGEYIGYYTSAVEILNNYGVPNGLNDGNGATYAFLCFNVEQPDHVVWNGLHVGGSYACYPMSLAGVPAPGVSGGSDSWLISSVENPFGANIVSGRAGLVRLVPFGAIVPGYDDVVNNCTNYPPIGDYYPVALHSPNAVIRAKRLPTYPLKMCRPGVPTVGAPAELPGNPDVCLFIDGQIAPQVNFTIESGSFLTLKDYADPGNVITQLPYGPTIRASDPRATDAAFWNAAADAVGIAERYNPPSLPQAIAQAAVGTANLSSVAAGGVTLAVIVRDICRRAGLRDEQIDVTALTDLVLGFQIGRQTSARADLEPLRQAFWFDAVESGDVIRFVKRGGAPVAHLTFDDLGAGEEQATEPMEPTRLQETDLPAAVAVAYSSVTADYQTGTQTARRMATVSQQQTGVELPVVLTDQHAANVADVLMYDAWTSRTERVTSVLRGWADLEPTDVITVDDGEFVYSLRIIDKEEDGPVIKLTMRDEDAAAYAPEAHAVPTPGGGSEVTFVGPTNLMMLDIPLLRQEDDRYGIYATARPFAGSWPGARVYRSIDTGISYVEVDTVARQGVMGYARTALADFAGGNVVDEINTVLVRIYGGELSSITYAELLNNGNAAVLGDEIIQYRTATLVEEGTYRLSGLLRGRLGTEHAMAGHATSERFVVLSAATLYRFSDSLALRDSPQFYKGVTFGQTMAGAVAVDGTNTGASQKPLSPVHLSAQPVPGGGYLARWVRRTRYGGAWLDTTDVPLGEASESYVVRVIDGSTVVEEQTVTSPTATLGVSASGYSLVPVMQLGSQIWAAKEVSGDLFGLRVDNVDSNAKRVIKLNAAGSLVAQSSGMGQQVFQAVHGTTSIYVITTDPLNPTLYRFAYSDISSPAATRGSALASDFGGVAFDGTNVWLAERSTNLLHRCDASTLATVASYAFDWDGDSPNAIYADGGYIWAIVGADIVKWDTSAEAEVDRVTAGSSELADIVLSPTMVFAIFQSATPRVEVYDRATLTLQATHSAAPFAPTYPGHYGLVHDGLVYVGDTARAVNLFDAGTGASLGQAALDVSGTDMAGVFGGRVVVSGSPTNNYLNITSSTYELGAPVAASDYSGMTLTVQQVSDTVGPGFPASITL